MAHSEWILTYDRQQLAEQTFCSFLSGYLERRYVIVVEHVFIHRTRMRALGLLFFIGSDVNDFEVVLKQEAMDRTPVLTYELFFLLEVNKHHVGELLFYEVEAFLID